MMMLGARAHDFGKLTIKEHAKIISEKGFSGIQLAPGKAISDFDTRPGRLNTGIANYIRDTLYSKNLNIAVLGCYINPVHPDNDERRRQLERFKEHIRYARDFGCSVVGTETGSLNADFSFNPDNHSEEAFLMLEKSIKELVREAERFGVIVAIEGVTKYVLNNPERIKRMIDDIGSNNLQVILDPVNLLSADNYQEQDEIIKKSFEFLGDRIIALHAKDFVLEEGKLISIQAGQGSLNYKLVFSLLKEYKPSCYILMENIRPDKVDEGVKYLKEIYHSI